MKQDELLEHLGINREYGLTYDIVKASTDKILEFIEDGEHQHAYKLLSLLSEHVIVSIVQKRASGNILEILRAVSQTYEQWRAL